MVRKFIDLGGGKIVQTDNLTTVATVNVDELTAAKVHRVMTILLTALNEAPAGWEGDEAANG